VVNSHEVVSKGVKEEEERGVADFVAGTGEGEGEGEGGREGGTLKLLGFVVCCLLRLLRLLLLLLLLLCRPGQRDTNCPSWVPGSVHTHSPFCCCCCCCSLPALWF
jgi:hypothetical protein